ncbi:MAG: MBL fold metallo-hydrolase [Gammaproteobacteria bacterium]|nr:MBL fold metallo-hydrolase [Gammaproteobacteria bacterium]
MKNKSIVLLMVLLLSNSVFAENLTQVNVKKAKGIIDEAVAAYGGAKQLSSMNTVMIEHETINIATGQSLKPEPPYDRNPSKGISAVDFENKIFVTHNEGTAVGFVFNNGTIINGDKSVQLDYRAGTLAKIAEPDFDTSSGPFMRVTPALLVRQLHDRSQNAYYLGETRIDDQDYDVVGFSMAVGPALSLYFERESRLLRRSERVLPDFGLVEYRFNDYQTINNIPFNDKFILYLNGDLNIERTNRITRVNSSIDHLTVADKNLISVAAIIPDELSRQEISDCVYQIGGNGTYAMFVEMQDYVIAVGGTAGSADRIEKLREVVPDKPIKYGVITHHHFDHVVAVSAYEAEGATVLASSAHKTVVKNAAKNSKNLKLKTVAKKRVLKDKTRRVEIIDIGPTAHTEHLLVAYLPNEGILFEADHFNIPQTGPVPPAVPSTRSFAEALKIHKIKPQKMLSAHSPRVSTMEDLHTALTKKVWKTTEM